MTDGESRESNLPVLAGFADLVRQRGSLQPEEKRRLEEAAINQLPPEARMAIHGLIQNEAAFANLNHNAIRIIADAQEKDKVFLNHSDRIIAERAVARIEELERLKELQIKQSALLTEMQVDSQQAIHAGYEAVRKDILTPLFLRRVLLDTYLPAMKSFLNEKFDLESMEVKVMDMLNFNIGNHILTNPGFDLFFHKFASWMVSVSRSTGSEVYKSGSEPDNIEMPLEWFAGNTDKATEAKTIVTQMVDDLKADGIIFTFFRDKPGGDETFALFEYKSGVTAEKKAKADKFLKSLVSMAKLPRHSGDKAGELQQIVDVVLGDDKNLGMVFSGLKLPENHAHASLNEFANELRLKLINEEAVVKGITGDESCQIKMGYASADINFKNALDNFLSSMFSSPDKPKKTTIEAYQQILLGRMERQIVDLQLKSDEEILHIANQMLSRDILGIAMQTAMAEVDNWIKFRDKKQLLISALSGNVTDSYQLGALVKAGRFVSDLRDDDRVEILQALTKHYKIEE